MNKPYYRIFDTVRKEYATDMAITPFGNIVDETGSGVDPDLGDAYDDFCQIEWNTQFLDSDRNPVFEGQWILHDEQLCQIGWDEFWADWAVENAEEVHIIRDLKYIRTVQLEKENNENLS